MNKKVDEEYKDIQDVYLLQCNCTELKEDLEYSNYCNEELRKKIINLDYKITTLEAYIKDLESRTPIASKKYYGDGREELQERMDKAIKYTENVLKESWYGGREKEIAKELLEVLKGENNE